MEFLKLDATRAEAWDRIVSTSAEGWLFGLYRWTQLLPRIPIWSFQDHSFLALENGDTVAAVPLQLTQDGRLCSNAMGGSGPMLAPGLSQADRERVMRGALGRVKEIGIAAKAREVVISTSPLSDRSLKGESYDWRAYGLKDISSNTWMLDLSPSMDLLFNGLSENARREIKQASRSGYTVRELKSRDEMNAYYEVHEETYHRTGAHPHPKEYFLGIYDEFTRHGLSRIWVADNADGRPVAFFNVAAFKKRGLYWTSCCRNKDVRLGVNYLLIWRALAAAKEEGFEYFDCGEAFPGAARGTKERGLSDFKRKFGGKLRPISIGKLVLRKPPVVRRIRGVLGATKRKIVSVLRGDGK